MKKFRQRLLTFLIGLLIFSATSYGQSSFPDINPKWDNYYKANPSGIEDNYQASDFISILRLVRFVSTRREMKGNRDLLETALLSLPQAGLRQMMIDGNYFSRTYKHDDYFLLYNKYYKTISKQTWDKYCPYLIPLMSVDDIISTH